MNLLKNLFRKPIPLYCNVLVVMAALFCSRLYFNSQNAMNVQKQEPVVAAPQLCNPDLRNVRLNQYQYARPLLMSDNSDESSKLLAVKSAAKLYISEQLTHGVLTNASVYIRQLSNGNWTVIDGNGQYNPGSLVKVAVLITYLSESERIKGLLDKKLFFSPSLAKITPHQSYEINSITPGRYYTIRELLHHVIVDSDNYSTTLLNINMNLEAFKKLYSDLDMPVPDVHDLSYTTDVIQYSKFLRVLYNASYLNPENSDMALKWLAESSFKDGMAKYIPAGIAMSRKFGEFGLGKTKQWHESAIVFNGSSPYLITVMTKGPDPMKLRDATSQISNIVFQKMSVSL